MDEIVVYRRLTGRSRPPSAIGVYIQIVTSVRSAIHVKVISRVMSIISNTLLFDNSSLVLGCQTRSDGSGSQAALEDPSIVFSRADNELLAFSRLAATIRGWL